MKTKNILFLLLLLSSLVIGCSGDDDGGGPSGPTVSNSVFGSWNMTLYFQNNTLETDVPCDEDLEYDIRSNGTYSKRSFSEPANGNNCEIALVINGTWEIIDDNVLIFTPADDNIDPETLTLELINNNMQLEISRVNGRVEVYNRI